MRMVNVITGDVAELPAPDQLGHTVLLLNGNVIEHVLLSDVTETATLGDGRVLAAGEEFASYVMGILQGRISKGKDNA